MIASRNTTAVAVVIAVNKEHDHGLRTLDLNAPRVSAMLSGLFLSPANNTLSVAVSGVGPAANWRFQLADVLARGLDSRLCNFLFHSPAWAGTSTCRVWSRSTVIAPLSFDEKVSAATCSSASSMGEADGRPGICESSPRLSGKPSEGNNLDARWKEGRRSGCAEKLGYAARNGAPAGLGNDREHGGIGR